jgi:primosomal protein N' (replication factor Y)
MAEHEARERRLPLVRVAIERGVEGEGLTYVSPWEGIGVGEQVVVPLGKKRARGVVVRVGGDELLEGFERGRVKRALERVGAGVPAEVVELGRWISAYYVTPLGMVLGSMVPGAVKRRTGRRVVKEVGRVEPEREGEILAMVEKGEAKLTGQAREAWAKIEGMGRGAFPMAGKALSAALGTTLGPVNRLMKLGLLQIVEREEIRARGYEPGEGDDGEAATGEGEEDVAHGRALVGVSGAARGPEPNEEQRVAIEGIGATLGAFGVHLLFGVTGSGKTEVYLRLIERVLAAGRSALVLVPEIALTPQTAARFEARFGASAGGRVAVLHSGLSASQRNRQWELASSGEARVVVGARSAVFSPMRGLGLIVVDEEHDGSYKQDTLPRYHGRDVAIKRAHMAGCPVVLGSATPALESWANATRGKYRLWTLRERAGAGRLPRVTIVDLAAEQPWQRGAVGEGGGGKGGGYAGGSGRGPLMIGATLRGALERTLGEGGQAILLLNRRGFATFMHCPSCKWTLSCTECDAAMVLHRGRELPLGEVVRCHHCLAERLVPKKCEACGERVVGLGIGTQRVEEELGTILAGMLGEEGAREGLLRVDADTIRGVRALHEAFGRFGEGRARVLLGTQMIAKGLDYPNVRLVGVISADTALNLPDFRAAERTFQLVAQVAGRAGRGVHEGRVVVQTFNPYAPAIRQAAAHDYEAFAAMELRAREAANLPPAWRMARVVVRDEDAAKGVKRARELGDLLRAGAKEEAGGARVDGPVPSALSRVGGWYRWDLLVRAPGQGSAGVVQRVLGRARVAGKLVSDAHTAVDVDPVSLM